MTQQTKYGFLIAALVMLLDQASKAWLLSLPDSSLPQALTSFFNLVMVWNRGISFGLMAGLGSQTVPLMIAAIMIALLVIWLKRADNRLHAGTIGLIIGGAVGNVVDRLRFGAVVDFLDFHVDQYHWPAFNVADSAICIGVLFLCWQTMANEDKQRR